jgi:hypothetical protein
MRCSQSFTLAFWSPPPPHSLPHLIPTFTALLRKQISSGNMPPRRPPQPTSTGCSTRACAAWAVDVLTPTAGSPAGPARAATATILLHVSWPAAAGDAAALPAGNYTVAGWFHYQDPTVARVESVFPAGRSCSPADGAAVTVSMRIASVRCSANLSARFLLPAAASALAPTAVAVPVCSDLPAGTSSGSGVLLTLAAPPHGRAGTAAVEILAGAGSKSVIVTANFTYTPASAVLMPADAPAGGIGSNLTATVWGWGGGGDGWGAAAVVARVVDGADGVERMAAVEFVETVRIQRTPVASPRLK